MWSHAAVTYIKDARLTLPSTPPMLRRFKLFRKTMHPQAPRAIPFASAPFDNPKGDLILRSCDGIDFRVFQAILAVSSDFFSTMFEAGQAPNEEMRDGCPVVRVSEEGQALDGLLRIIYPTKAPPLTDLRTIGSVLAAALKYDVEKAVAVAREALLTFIPKEPLRVWAIAVRYRLEMDARLAAQEMVNRQISLLDSVPPEVCEIHAGAYYRLLQFKRSQASVPSTFKFCDPSTSHDSPQPPQPISRPSGCNPNFISSAHERIRAFVDVECRSSDRVQFQAHKAFLAFASPIMGEMMAGSPTPAAPSSQEAGELPVVPFAEDGATLKVILGLCYPAADDENVVCVFPITQKVMDAVAKYEMKAVAKMLRRHWAELSKSDPLQAYLRAAWQGLNNEAAQAAHDLIAWRHDRRNDINSYYVAVMETTPALVYYEVLVGLVGKESTQLMSTQWSKAGGSQKRRSQVRRGSRLHI